LELQKIPRFCAVCENRFPQKIPQFCRIETMPSRLQMGLELLSSLMNTPVRSPVAAILLILLLA